MPSVLVALSLVLTPLLMPMTVPTATVKLVPVVALETATVSVKHDPEASGLVSVNCHASVPTAAKVELDTKVPDTVPVDQLPAAVNRNVDPTAKVPAVAHTWKVIRVVVPERLHETSSTRTSPVEAATAGAADPDASTGTDQAAPWIRCLRAGPVAPARSSSLM